MNTKNSSWKEERDLQQEVAEVLAHGHCWGAEFGERGRQARARGCWSTATERTTTMHTATGRQGWRGGMDLVDVVDLMDEGLRLAKGTLRHEQTRKGTDRHEKARYFENFIFLGAGWKRHP